MSTSNAGDVLDAEATDDGSSNLIDSSNNNNNNNQNANENSNGIEVPEANADISEEIIFENNDADDFGSEFTPSSLESGFDNESLRFPSQGSDFFCPASPTYTPSLPCMSQPSQESWNSSTTANNSNIINNLDNQDVFLQQSEYSLQTTDDTLDENSETSNSQPETKRIRLDSE